MLVTCETLFEMLKARKSLIVQAALGQLATNQYSASILAAIGVCVLIGCPAVLHVDDTRY